MTNLTNILEMNAAGADYLGFIFHSKSPRFLSDTSVLKNIPHNIDTVAVTVDMPIKQIVELVCNFGFNYVQLHGKETVQTCLTLKEAGIKIIKAFRIDDNFDMHSVDQYVSVCDFFLFDAAGKAEGGNGVKFNWEKLTSYSLGKPFFLSGGIGLNDVDNISIATEIPGFYAVDINSKFEIKPGLKNPVDVAKFIVETKLKYN